METLEIEDTDLAEEIRKRMFCFRGYPYAGQPFDPEVPADVDNNLLAIALKGATEEVRRSSIQICQRGF